MDSNWDKNNANFLELAQQFGFRWVVMDANIIFKILF